MATATVVLQAGGLTSLTAEQIAAGGGTLVLAVIVTLFVRDDLISKRQHTRTIELLEAAIRAKQEELQRLEEAKDAEIERTAADRDLWREIAADALNVSEALVGRRR